MIVRRPLLFAASLLGGSGCQQVDVYAVTRGEVPDVTTTTASTGEPDVVTTSGSSGESDGATTSSASDEPDVVSSSGSPSQETADDGGVPPDSCSRQLATPGDTSVTVQVGSLTRNYVLHVPQTFDAAHAAPLIIDFHGAGGTGWDQLSSSTYPAVTDPEGVIMAFPDGVNGPIGNAWNVGPCCVPGVDDLAFVDALIADVSQRVCVDMRRIYAVGVLTGGGMVHHLACQRADVFAAVSPAAFDLIEETVDSCIPTSPVGVVAFRGTADVRVPYEGGSASLVPSMPVTFLGAEASFQRWASINGCLGEPSEPDAQGCSAYTGCGGGTEVVLCTKQGGRGEPGEAAIAWPILERHSR